jgi:hypothetical protein
MSQSPFCEKVFCSSDGLAEVNELGEKKKKKNYGH